MTLAHTVSRLSVDGLAALLDVSRRLAAPFDLQGMLEAVTAAACNVLCAERASVWLLDESAGELTLAVTSDLDHIRLPLGPAWWASAHATA